MTEDDVVYLFKQASTLGYRFDIALPGDDSLVPIAGVNGDLDHRLSDAEHVIHELAHCILDGMNLASPDVMREYTIKTLDRTQEQKEADEIETFSVTMEVLRRFNIVFHEVDFEISLFDFQIDLTESRYPKKDRRTLWETAKTFHTTVRGSSTVDMIVRLLKEAE